MIPVENWFKMSFCAVPALRRVLPVTNSGPVLATSGMDTEPAKAPSGFEVMPMVVMPCSDAHFMAPSHIRCSATGGNAHHHISCVCAMPLQIPDASLCIVLGTFNGFSNGAVSPRNQPDKNALHAKCGAVFHWASSTPKRPLVPAPR